MQFWNYFKFYDFLLKSAIINVCYVILMVGKMSNKMSKKDKVPFYVPQYETLVLGENCSESEVKSTKKLKPNLVLTLVKHDLEKNNAIKVTELQRRLFEESLHLSNVQNNLIKLIYSKVESYRVPLILKAPRESEEKHMFIGDISDSLKSFQGNYQYFLDSWSTPLPNIKKISTLEDMKEQPKRQRRTIRALSVDTRGSEGACRRVMLAAARDVLDTHSEEFKALVHK